ncbi:zinc phosphodiesterase ELAC protein 2 isoform X2 [Echeneis naucrates]|uniref:Zinc phosphodiesterase ELAC protein 2 n=1 Tax=Echeneis naucrates TaxID=173247 RepID=A0A665T9X3_ECHNA|nr:zinc phosphodiesterase ELAC protein 2 isoform X2 [Echeneis naucrates]
MNTAHLKLRYFTSLLVKGRAAPLLTRPDSPTILRFIRTMATNNIKDSKNNNINNNNNKKAKQKEPLRRLKTKEGRSKRGDVHGPSTVYLQVVGAGTRDNAASLYVFSEYNRYLFNCGEGTQRLMQEHKLKAAHLDNIFLTRLSWENVGGLSGMILTLKDTGVPECVLSGPPQLENYINAIKSFSGPLEDIKLSVRPYTAETYTDDTMTVHQVPIFAQSKDRGRSPSPGAGGPASPKRDNVDRDRPHSPGDRQTAARDSSLVVAFICKLHPKKGNFLVPEALKLGLPVGTAAIGPLIKALKAGSSITFEGREIRPEQVCTPTDPGPIFVIVECPTEEFVDAVCTNQQLRRHQTEGEEDSAALVVHITPESVLKTETYKEWMERFPSTTQHLILNEQACTVHNIRSHKIQAQLNMIHPEIFPHLKSYKAEEPQAALNVAVVRAECLLKFQLRPVMEWQRDALPSCNAEEFVREAAEVPNFLEEVEKCRKICSTDAADLSGQGVEYPEVVFMGTGSALPMKIRNVSGTLVNISPSQSLLLDCGEGTFGQLCRHYGDDVDDVLCKISTVFISHLHADHHTGLLNLLYQRERAMRTSGKTFSPIYLIAPGQIMMWLNQYHDSCGEILNHISLIPNRSLSEDAEPTKPWMKSLIGAALEKNDLLKFQTCLVRHCKNAFACSFTHRSGWKLAFSGDTMPCDGFVRIGKDASLLIHEATLEDGMEAEAAEKRHSTTSQAIGIGMEMNAGFIMLNHFSQRYAKIPLFSEDFSDRVGISFDHMRICPGDLKILPRLIPALKTLFAEEIEEMEERREKRELKHPRGSSSERNMTGRAAKREQEEAATHIVETKRQKTSSMKQHFSHFL